MALRNIPYSNIIDEFTQACQANLGISTFDTGTIDFLDANAVNKNYPYIYLRPISSPGVVDKVRSLTFELYSLDVPTLQNQSPVDLLSQCEERIYQLLAWFNKGETQIQQTYEVSITDLSPVNEAFEDRVFGWVATIEVATPWVWDYCDYPQAWPTPTPTASPTATPPPSPTATATPTPSASPTGTPVPPTPTPTTSATPIPPTSTPTATPFVQSFILLSPSSSWSDIPGEVCDTTVDNPSDYIQVYAESDNPLQLFPENVYSQRIYTDSNLNTPYTQSIDVDQYYASIRSDSGGTIYQVKMDRFADDNWEAADYSVCPVLLPTATPTPSPTATPSPTPSPTATPTVVQFRIGSEAARWSSNAGATCSNFNNVGQVVYAYETNAGLSFPDNIQGSTPYTDNQLTQQFTMAGTVNDYWAPIWQTDDVYAVQINLTTPGNLISFRDVPAEDCSILIPTPTALPPTATPTPTAAPEWFGFIGQPVSASLQDSSFVGECTNTKDDVKYYWVYDAPSSGDVFCRISGSTGQIYNSPNLNDPVAVQSTVQQVKYLYIDGPSDPGSDDWSHQWKIVQATGSYDWFIHSIYDCANNEIECP